MQDNFLQVSHTLDLLADHPESFVITPHAIYLVNQNESEIIPLTETQYHELRHTLLYLYRDKEE